MAVNGCFTSKSCFAFDYYGFRESSSLFFTEGITGGALEFINGQETFVMFPHKDNLDAASLLESPNGCTFS